MWFERSGISIFSKNPPKIIYSSVDGMKLSNQTTSTSLKTRWSVLLHQLSIVLQQGVKMHSEEDKDEATLDSSHHVAYELLT